MSALESFSAVKASLEAIDIPKSFKAEAMGEIGYFISQAELPIERRDHPKEIQRRWNIHFSKMKSVQIYNQIKNDETAWRVLQCFVFAGEPSNLIIPAPAVKVEPIEKLGTMDVEPFFIKLSGDLGSKKRILGSNYLGVYLCLKFFQSEARHSRGKRDIKEIERLARWVQPYLWDLGLLKDYEMEKSLQEKINFFLNDGLQTRFNFFHLLKE
jgi:hypothetical protein